MRIIATKEQVAALPDAASMLIRNGWGEPDENGVRQALPRFDSPGKFDLTGPTVCHEIETALNERDATFVNFSYTFEDDGAGRFRRHVIWRDPYAEILSNLVDVWNNRDAIGRCHHCGNLFVPGRGRTAKFCSPKCRTAAHRYRIEVPLTQYGGNE